MRARLAAASGAALLIIVGSPYIGQIRGAVQQAVPGQYRLIVGGIVAVSVAGALGWAVLTIRERRPARYLALVAALVIGTLYARLTSTGSTDIDLVERFHFVEYGLLTWLFYRVWNNRRDARTIVFPAAAAMLTGLLDEGFQWFVPLRVGELHDVLLNGAAVVCGLLFSLGTDRLAPVQSPLSPRARVNVGLVLSIALIACAAFVQTVHFGFAIRDDRTGTFLSRFSRQALEDAARERAVQWAATPPTLLRRVSREDQYLAEGVWHIRRRNEAIALGDVDTAWGENRILEIFFAPVLDVPSYAAPGARWPPEQRADVEARLTADVAAYISDALSPPIYTWSRAALWAVTGLLVGIVGLWSVWPRLRMTVSKSSTAASIT